MPTDAEKRMRRVHVYETKSSPHGPRDNVLGVENREAHLADYRPIENVCLDKTFVDQVLSGKLLSVWV